MTTITNYGTLKTALAEELARSDLTTQIPQFIQRAEFRIYREIRCRYSEVGDVLTTATAGIHAGTLAVPANYIEMIRLALTDDDVPLTPTTSEVIKSKYYPPCTGTPVLFTRAKGDADNERWEFGPTIADPSVGVEFNIHYHGSQPAMSADGDAPWPIGRAPYLVFYASLVNAYSYIRDAAQKADAEAEYRIEAAGLEREYRREKFSGGQLETHRA